jgi:exopolysaccharide biosynthesis WecB/TagA/CpsF family protein
MVGDCLAARGGNRRPKLVFASNGHAIALAASDAQFRQYFRAANLIHADGQPVVLASKLLTRHPIPERSATTDFIHDAARAAAESGLGFFLLGGTESLNAQCASILGADYSGLRIAGRRNGYFHEDEEAALCEAINASGADILWVGLGVPLEYEFCLRNRHRLNPGWIVTCGGCFKFVTGGYARAPRWMQASGLEWLYRLLREPRRLFRRYAVTNPLAIFALLTRTGTSIASTLAESAAR